MSAPLRFARPKASAALRGVLGTTFALFVAGLALAPRLWLGELNPDAAAPISLHAAGGAFVPRGNTLSQSEGAEAIARLWSGGTDITALSPSAVGLVLAAGLAAGWLFYAFERRRGRMRRRREHIAVFGWLLLAALACRAWLSAAPLSAGYLPAVAFVVPVALHLGKRVALALALPLGTLAALLVGPVDPVLGVSVGAACLGATAALPERRRKWRWTLPLTLASAVFGTVAYIAARLLFFGDLAPADLASVEAGRLSGVAVGGLIWPLVGIALAPLFERAIGDLSRSTLLELSDLNNPSLQTIQQRSPGTWAHSRQMANLAESAAHAINADALLIRVGAYYHDLGKSVEPQFFIENVPRGNDSAHAELDPQTSADKIIGHVRHSVHMGREAGLPEAIIDFMHTHHGESRVEFFYQRARQAAENPDEVDPVAFTYPGENPQTKETGILMIVDSVEAASRTVAEPTRAALEKLVNHIVHHKLALGLLDECELTLEDLKKIEANLVDTILHSSHDRITYPWQEEERQREREASAKHVAAGSAPESAPPLPRAAPPAAAPPAPASADAAGRLRVLPDEAPKASE